METSSGDDLTQAQNELYGWIKEYMKNFQHSPSIRQMMQAMGLKSVSYTHLTLPTNSGV